MDTGYGPGPNQAPGLWTPPFTDSCSWLCSILNGLLYMDRPIFEKLKDQKRFTERQLAKSWDLSRGAPVDPQSTQRSLRKTQRKTVA